MIPAAVVLDVDGTLVDTESANLAAHAEEYARFGLELDRALMVAAIGSSRWTDQVDPLVRLAGLVGRGFDLAASRRRVRAGHVRLVAAAPLRPGVAGLLASARAAGVPVATASGSRHDWVDTLLDRFGLAGQVAAVCCEEDVVRTKPYPDLYQLACRRLGAEPADAVAVEDSAVGVRAAVDAGVFCVAVPNPMTAAQDLAAAHLRADSLADLGWSALVSAHARWRTSSGAARRTG